MPESPTREDIIPQDPSGECHGSKAPAGDSRDGEDQLGELHTALIIVGEAHNGQDYAKASYHGQGHDGEPLPESLTMETTRSESPTRENAMPEFSLVGLSDLVVSIVRLSGKGSPSWPCPW